MAQPSNHIVYRVKTINHPSHSYTQWLHLSTLHTRILQHKDTQRHGKHSHTTLLLFSLLHLTHSFSATHHPSLAQAAIRNIQYIHTYIELVLHDLPIQTDAAQASLLPPMNTLNKSVWRIHVCRSCLMIVHTVLHT